MKRKMIVSVYPWSSAFPVLAKYKRLNGTGTYSQAFSSIQELKNYFSCFYPASIRVVYRFVSF